MNRSSAVQAAVFSELSFWCLVCAVALFFVLPLRQQLKFGFDLKGGTYLTLEVETDKAIEAELVDYMQAAEDQLRDARAAKAVTRDIKDGVLSFTFDSMQEAQSAAEILRAASESKDFIYDAKDMMLGIRMKDDAKRRIANSAVDQDIDVLRVRVESLGVGGIDVMRKGERGIIVELPDVQDPQLAKSMIGKAAQLEFRITDNPSPARSRADIEYKFDEGIPLDKEILPGEGGYYLVQRYAEVTGKMLKDARPGVSQGQRSHGQPAVSFQLNDAGAQKFADLTSENVGKYLAIVLDGRVVSAPHIPGPITGGNVEISGNFTMDRAKHEARLLRSGSFVAPVTFQEERHVGPSLGAESIRKGLLSCLIGLGLLFVFALFYYRLAGIFAFLALIFNLILVLFGLYILRQPLTLPGIGGMVLTVGMAIDASILIFEHIKEEQLKGLGLREAIYSGFSGAMTVILDANITTLIVGVVLFYFGTGPIKGFAVTMMLGILATLVTGLFFLRSLFKFALSVLRVKEIKF